LTGPQIAFAVISGVLTLASLGMSALNAWGRLQIKNEILQLRVYVSDHYVSKDTLDQVVQRLERLLDRLEQRVDGARGARQA
jgi:hypothetical protein